MFTRESAKTHLKQEFVNPRARSGQHQNRNSSLPNAGRSSRNYSLCKFSGGRFGKHEWSEGGRESGR
eukprot:807412-Pleurochrysis_carterae.AAC.3